MPFIEISGINCRHGLGNGNGNGNRWRVGGKFPLLLRLLLTAYCLLQPNAWLFAQDGGVKHTIPY